MTPSTGRLRIDRDSYFDSKGKANNKMLGFEYDDDDLLGYIRNIYAVLLTRGIRGTYVYVCDRALREHLAQFIAPDEGRLTPPDIAAAGRSITSLNLQLALGPASDHVES